MGEFDRVTGRVYTTIDEIRLDYNGNIFNDELIYIFFCIFFNLQQRKTQTKD